jgi:hypothetical protein
VRANVAEAAELDRRLRAEFRSVGESIERIKELIDQAKAGEVYVALGFRSWPEYIADVVRNEVGKLHRDHRRQIVEVLVKAGMSDSSIADAVGVSDTTAYKDRAAIQAEQQVLQKEVPARPPIITGRNGSQHPANRQRRPKPPPPPPTDEDRAQIIAERVGERARGLAKSMRDLIGQADLTPEMARWIPILTFPAIDDLYDAEKELFDWLDTVADSSPPTLKAVP